MRTFFPQYTRTATLLACALMTFLGMTQAHAASITGISPTHLRPGTLLEITGNGFGSAPFEGTQVCFAENLCTTTANFSTFVKGWSNNLITVLVPYQDIPATGKMSVVLPTATGGELLQSPSYTYSKMDPEVNQTSTQVINPGVTDLVITGKNFLQFTPGKSTICIENNCLTDTQLGTNIIAWSDTSITLRVPYVAGHTTFAINVVIYDPLLENIPGATTQRVVSIPGFTYQIPPQPQITGIAPTDVYPGNTILIITGQGFGDSYTAGNNQLCFGDRCLSDTTDVPQLLQSWSPTRIALKAPLWLAVASTDVDTFSVRVYDPVEQRFTFVQAPSKITIKPVPVITEMVPLMDMGAIYLVRGRNFGLTPGGVTINDVPVDARSWTDNTITFWVGDDVQSGFLHVRSSDGKTSQQVPVTIRPQPIYSKDEFTRLMWYFGTLGVQEAWTKTRGSQDIVVAVVDSGIDFTHEDLQGTNWVNPREIAANGKDDDGNGYVDDISGWNFVQNKPTNGPQNSHGTMVASVIAAKADNYMGLTGIAPGVRLMNLQVTTPADATFNEDYITLNDAQRAIKYAVDNGADIINLSFASANNTDAKLYADVIAYAYARNVLVVVAAGNEGKNLNTVKYSPVCDDNENPYALGVSSVGSSGITSTFANFGTACIDVYAPGEKIVAGAPDSSQGGIYMLAEGTSFAAPLVSGTAALLRSLHPDWNVAEVRAAIINSAQTRNNLPQLAVAKTLDAKKPQVSYTPDASAKGTATNEDVVFYSDPVPSTPVVPEDPKQPTNPDPIIEVEPTTTPARSFNDIPDSSSFYIPVTELSRSGVIQGYSDGSYRPLTPVNRAEFLKILIEGADITPDAAKYRNCFPDVTTEWFAPYVCYAKELGVVEGYPGATDAKGNRLFMPDKTMNKVEALKVILTYNKVPLAKGKNSYNDAEAGSWYYPYVTTAERLGLLDERFILRPSDSLSRGVMAQIIYRLNVWLAAQKDV